MENVEFKNHVQKLENKIKNLDKNIEQREKEKNNKISAEID